MQDYHTPGDHASQVIDSARAADHAIQHLCRTTLTRPNMTPAEAGTVLAHLVAAAAALPQAGGQLGNILAHSKEEHVLEMDSLTGADDPDLAIDRLPLVKPALPAILNVAPQNFRSPKVRQRN